MRLILMKYINVGLKKFGYIVKKKIIITMIEKVIKLDIKFNVVIFTMETDVIIVGVNIISTTKIV